MFFVVKEPLKIAEKVYITCICYSLPKHLEPTIRKLADEGRAVIYKERVFFQNGKIIEKKTEEVKTSKKSNKEIATKETANNEDF